jgi:hypothetical protein
MSKLLLLFIFALVSGTSRSQDLTGTWEGHSSNMASYVKMVIMRQGNTYIGYTYDDGMGYCQANFLGSFDDTRQLLTGKGMGFIRRSWTHSQARYRLTYSQRGDTHHLDGVALPKTVLTTILSFGMSERVNLQRTSLSVDTTPFMRERLEKNITVIQPADTVNNDPDDAAMTPPDSAFTDPVAITPPETPARSNMRIAKEQRTTDTISRITTQEKTITITLFDNGQVDGDTITVFHNNQILLSQHFVSATPYKIVLTLSKQQPVHELVLVANNLGSIPPNTAVLLVDAGEKRYRLTASSDLKKNALIIFEYKE